MSEPAFVIPPPRLPSVAVAGSGARFPVRRILCVGRNYAAHAREMGADLREPPFFFTKPADAVCDSGTAVPYPSLTANLHHEVELVVAIGTGGADIAAGAALAHVWGYGVGIDLTRRDLQNAAKAKGHPWDWGKAFDLSAPCGPLTPAAACGDLTDARIELSVNGTVRQSATTADMIWSVPEIIAAASTAIRLEPGDLIYTGTPEGVGPVVAGDRLEATVAGLAPLAITVS